MHRLTPTARQTMRLTRTGSAALDNVLDFHARTSQRRILGVRLTAIAEVLVFVGLTILLSRLQAHGWKWAPMMPHPMWIAVLLMSAYYGLREGLFTAVVGTVMILMAPFPVRDIGEGGYAWLLRGMRDPILWVLTAIVVGEIRDAVRRRMLRLQERTLVAEERNHDLTLACDRLSRHKTELETRVAEQSMSLHTMYQASSAVERDSVGDVLLGAVDLVRTGLAPQKFSIFLLHGDHLEAALSERWGMDDRFARSVGAASPLFDAIVNQRRQVVVAHAGDQQILGHEGVMAGPLIDADRDVVIGMLKIEAMHFVDLHATSIQNFQLLCRWIGAAITHAQRQERYLQGDTAMQTAHVGPPALVEPVRALMETVVSRTGMDATMLIIDLTLEAAHRRNASALAIGKVVAGAAARVLKPAPVCCAISDTSFMVVIPQRDVDTAKPVAARIVMALRDSLEDIGVHAMLRHRLAPMVPMRHAA